MTEQNLRLFGVRWRRNTIRLVLAPILAIALFWLTFQFIFLPQVESLLVMKKERVLRDISAMALFQLDHFYEQSLELPNSVDSLKREAMDHLRTFRLGLNSTDYFWVTDESTTVLLMHPIIPELEGNNALGIPGPDSIFPGVMFDRIISEKGSGSVTYPWPYPGNVERVEPKMSFVTLYEPWGWIIGNGAYMNDVYAEVDAFMHLLRNSALGITALIVLLVVYISRNAFISERERMNADRKREEMLFKLQDSMERVHTLRGLLPICSKCKKVRDDKGYWQNVEHYISDQLETEFSHGLCPDCHEEQLQEIEKLRPGREYWDRQ